MKYYEVIVNAESSLGEWQGVGYWHVKPAREHFEQMLKDVVRALGHGVAEHNLWHDSGLVIMVSVIDVDQDVSAKYQADAYNHDQAEAWPTLKWHLVACRYSLNGEIDHGQG